jgi:hypothetical protein
MRFNRISIVFCVCALALAGLSPGVMRHALAQESAATPAPPPLPSPKPATDDPKVHRLAVTQFIAWQVGSIDHSLYSDEFNSQLSDSVVNDATQTLAHMGGLQTTTFRGISVAKGINVFVYHMVCEHGSIDMDFALQPDGKIALLLFE